MQLKMKPVLSLAVLAAALAVAGCNHTQAQSRTDADVAGDIQGRVNADQAVQNKQIAVQAANGVVTLSGPVSSDAERSAAAADAASAAGVRTVVNNLSVAPPQAAPQTAAAEPPAPAAPVQTYAPESRTRPEPAEARSRNRHNRILEREYKHDSRHEDRQNRGRTPAPWQPHGAQVQKPSPARYSQPEATYAQAEAPGRPADQEGVPQQQPAYAPPPPAAEPAYAPPPAPAQPTTVRVPNGTALSIRLQDPLDSETANAGDPFRATLSAPIDLDGGIVVPSDADVTGRVVDVHSAGRFKGAAMLTLELTQLRFNGRSYAIRTALWTKEIQGRGKNTAEKVGGGAALGAVIGALAGGGRGAAIGTVVGAGAGGTAQAVTHGKQITLEPETLLTFRLDQPVTVHPASVNERNRERQRLE